jgi:hypothetical protein
VRLKGYACSAALVALAAAAIPMRALTAQQVGRDSSVRDSVTVPPAAGDTLARPPVPLSMRLRKDTLFLARPPVFGDFGRFGSAREATEDMAQRRSDALQNAHALRRSALWGTTLRDAFAPVALPDSGAARQLAEQPPELQAPGIVPPSPLLTDTTAQVAARDSLPEAMRVASDLLGQYADLGLQLQARLSSKLERNKNERCTSFDILNPVANCSGSFQPQFDFQFNVRTGGTVADRVHVNVDYDSEREFDASNNINVYYEGKSDEIIHRLEVGNVSFSPPSSRFITGGIPAGNYGLQATGQLGPMNFRTIVAQQKGNVVKDRVFTVGDRTVQSVARDIEDYQIERRRFFWVVDPTVEFASQYPNIDVLDNASMSALVSQLPSNRRPRRVLVYRYRPPSVSGSIAGDINGPTAVALGARNQNPIGPYQVLQQGVDYYIDPTNLWIALVSPINRGERLAISYTVTGPGGTEVTVPTLGGTLPTAANPNQPDTLVLLWDNEVLPGDQPFNRELRNIYRLGGEDIQRNTVELKLVVGSGDQERSQAAGAPTYLQVYGLAQRTNTSAFDVENRLWPRQGDPNQAANAGGGSTKLIRDYFVIFPSLQPFANAGLADPPDPVNDSLYRTPDDDLYSQRRPPTQYRLRARYQADGGGDIGVIALGSVQVRAGSERLAMNGVPLVREVDYSVDYELGQVTFLRPDTLFRTAKQVQVQYEENPLFASAPTSIFGIASEFPFQNGQLNFVAISQSQKTTFNRPPLGFEPASSLVAGVNGTFGWESGALTRMLDGLPMVETTTPSFITFQGEIATSRPQPNAAGQAYVESFEGEGGIPLSLSELAWRLGSQPAVPGGATNVAGVPFDFDTSTAGTLAWQNLAAVFDSATGQANAVQFFAEQIDTTITFTGSNAFRSPEQVLWMTLYPLGIGGQFCNECARSDFKWKIPGLTGRRWRSLSQTLSTSGVDLSRVENLDFWVLIDTSTAGRRGNPALVFDFGDISENSVSVVPETLVVQTVTDTLRNGGFRARIDSTWFGRRIERFGVMDSERDPITKSFDHVRNDVGLPSHRPDSLFVVQIDSGVQGMRFDVPICRHDGLQLQLLGDTKNNCTVGNRQLDEEDLDLDGVLNLAPTQRDNERLLRYIIDLSDASLYNRFGRCLPSVTDSITGAGSFCWVNVRVPFGAPTEVVNDPLVRRIKSLRLTMVSSPFAGEVLSQVPVARLKLVGSPWVKRGDGALGGVGGTRPEGSGFVIATVIGTQDRDNRAGGLFYESPPGVVDQADNKQSDFDQGIIQINEKSMRIVAGDVPLFSRVEAFYRFPEGEKSFMGYKELRVWARGRNKGWGPAGDMNFFVKVGRDQDNFYLYRTPVNSGQTRDAWLPEVVVDFDRFYALRAQVQNNFLQSGEQIACTGIDSLLVVTSELPTAPGSTRYAACADGYIVYTANPGITPPNLAGVQEMAVGMLRIGDTGLGDGGAIFPTDSLEIWVDDIRLTGVVDDPGYAGQVAFNVQAGDVGTVQLTASRRDRNFRQLAEQPTYNTASDFGVSTSFRLDRFLPQGLGLILPMSVSYSSSGNDPFFLARSDVQAAGVEGLRVPKSHAMNYSISARRATPLRGSVFAPIVNNLNVTANYGTASSTSEYATGTSSRMSGAVDWSLQATARTARLPGWFTGLLGILPGFIENSDAVRSMKNTEFRWNPTQLRFSSTYAKTEDSRRAFTLPVTSAVDSGRPVNGLTSVLRNVALLEMRPIPAITARWNVTSVRDLRDYGDSIPLGGTLNVGQVARGERDQLLGVDLGLERERQMNMVLNFSPAVSTWFRPRFDFNTSYSLLRDPNTPRLLQVGDSTGAFKLPRRLTNSQGLGVGTSMDVSREILLHTNDRSRYRRIAALLQPIDVSWRRDLRSSFDGVPFTPGLGYQFGFGGVDDFREQNGRPATSAGVTRNLTAGSGLNLPFGTTLQSRYTRTTSSAFSRRLDAQTIIESESKTFPDLSLRWSMRPQRLAFLFQSLGAAAEWRETEAMTFQPTVGEGGGDVDQNDAGIRSEQSNSVYRISPSITWALGSGLTTAGGWSKTDRTEIKSGGVTRGQTTEISGNVGKAFKLPEKYQGRLLRWSMGFAKSSSESYFESGETLKRVQDLGRWGVNMNADTDVAENMTFSMTLSRSSSFDNLYDRRFTQMVVTATLHLTFFAGDLR